MVNQIVDDLIREIKNEVYDLECGLPSENVLAKTYGISRHEVRKAYERLSEMGYIVTSPGVGRFVKAKKDKIEIYLKGSMSFTQKIQGQGYHLKTELIEATVIKPNPKFKALQHSNEQIARISRLRIIEGEAMAIHTSYVSTHTFKDILNDAQTINSMFNYYESKGRCAFYYKDVTIFSVLPSNEESEILKCPSLVPVIVIEMCCYDKNTQELIDLTKITYRSDRFICKINSNEN